MNDVSFSTKRKFLIKLGKALHHYGTPSHRLEAHLENVAKFIGVDASFVVAPTSIIFSFRASGEEHEYNHIARVKPGELHLGNLGRTDAVVEELGHRWSIEEADKRLDEIATKQNPYSHLTNFLAFGFSGGAFAMLMHSSWNDVLWSSVLSLLVYLVVILSAFSKRVAYMLEPLAAMSAAFFATLISHYDPAINIRLATLSSIIIFIPGLALLRGLSELSAQQLVSGSGRVMDALMQMFKLYFGALLGITFAELIFGKTTFVATTPVPEWTSWLAVGILSATLVVLFKTRKRDTPWVLASGFLAYTVSLLAAPYLGIALGAFAGSFAIGIFSNLFARFLKTPAMIVALPGLVVLVPGSKVFIGLNTLISGTEMIPTHQIGQQAFLIFMSLVAGLIFANVAIAPRRSL